MSETESAPEVDERLPPSGADGRRQAGRNTPGKLWRERAIRFGIAPLIGCVGWAIKGDLGIVAIWGFGLVAGQFVVWLFYLRDRRRFAG